MSTGSLEHGNPPDFVAIAATSYCSMENTSLELVILAPLGVRVMEEGGGLSGRSRATWAKGEVRRKTLELALCLESVAARIGYRQSLVWAEYYPIGLEFESTKR